TLHCPATKPVDDAVLTRALAGAPDGAPHRVCAMRPLVVPAKPPKGGAEPGPHGHGTRHDLLNTVVVGCSKPTTWCVEFRSTVRESSRDWPRATASRDCRSLKCSTIPSQLSNVKNS